MPIEFPCPTCHQQVRTPDAAAGKKGKCPNCGTIVIIPAPVVALPPASPIPKHQPKTPPEHKPPESKPFESRPFAGPKPAPPPAPAAKPVPEPKPQIEFKPPSRPPDLARMPPSSKPAGSAPPASQALPTSPSSTATAAIEFNCPTCHKIVRTPAATAGKK